MGTLSGKVSFSFLSNAVARSEAKADGDSVEGAAPTLPVSEARSMPCSCAPVSCIAWGSEGRQVDPNLVLFVYYLLLLCVNTG